MMFKITRKDISKSKYYSKSSLHTSKSYELMNNLFLKKKVKICLICREHLRSLLLKVFNKNTTTKKKSALHVPIFQLLYNSHFKLDINSYNSTYTLDFSWV